MDKCLKCGADNVAACEGDQIGLIGCLDRQVELLTKSLKDTGSELQEVTLLLRGASAAANEYRDHRDMAELQRNGLRSENIDLRRQLAAANERANTYLGEMVRLQEALDAAGERADGAANLINKACLYAYENANTAADTEHGEGYKLGVSHMASILGGA